MRVFESVNATGIVAVAVAIVMSLAGLAEARDRDGRHPVRKPHHERSVRQLDYSVTNGDRRDDRRSIDRRELRRQNGRTIARHDRREDRKLRHRPDRSISTLRDYSTYSGGISAWRERGNGIYIGRDNSDYGYSDDRRERLHRRGTAKVIVVRPGRGDRSCSYEAGVCIVRGR